MWLSTHNPKPYYVNYTALLLLLEPYFHYQPELEPAYKSFYRQWVEYGINHQDPFTLIGSARYFLHSDNIFLNSGAEAILQHYWTQKDYIEFNKIVVIDHYHKEYNIPIYPKDYLKGVKEVTNYFFNGGE